MVVDTQETPRLRGEFGKGVTLIIAQTMPLFAIVALLPAIPKLFQQFGGYPNAPLLIPMIVTAPSLCIAIFAPFSGWIADKLGRRPTLVASFAVYFFAGIAPLVLDDLIAIIASRAVLGLAEAAIVT